MPLTIATRVRKPPLRLPPDRVVASSRSGRPVGLAPLTAQRAGRTAWAVVIALAAAACLPPNSRVGSSPASSPGASATATPATAASTGPRVSAPFVRPTPTPAPSFLVYTVKAGDSLNSIAHHFGTTGRSIAYWNGRTYPSLDPESGQYQPGLLKVGWTLQIIPNVTFDEQTLPEPSDLIDDTPSESADDSLDPAASVAY